MRKRVAIVSIVSLLAGLTVLVPGMPALAASCTWTPVKVKPPSMTPTGSFSFYGAAASSTTDLWAVGLTHDNGNNAPLAYHKKLAGWKLIPNDVTAGWFTSVADLSRKNAWLVGSSGIGDPNDIYDASVPLFEHWDGATLQPVPSPATATTQSGRTVTITSMAAISAVSANDIWAVGFGSVQGSSRNDSAGVIEHWDGLGWTVSFVLDQPFNQVNDGPEDILTGVLSLATDDVWAIGLYGFSASSVILHFDGTSWQIVQHSFRMNVSRIAASSSDNVWLGGGPAFLEQWNGSSFTQETPPPRSDQSGTPAGLAVSPTDTYSLDSMVGILDWNGSAWSETTFESIDSTINRPNMEQVISVPGSGDLWAFGVKGNPVQKVLALHAVC